MNSFYLIWAFNFQKNSTVSFKSWKKISSKLGAKGIKRSRILGWFKKWVELLRQEIRSHTFCLKNQFSCNFFFPKTAKLKTSAHFFKLAQKFRFFWYPLRTILWKFFQLLDGVQYLKLVLRFQGQTINTWSVLNF